MRRFLKQVLFFLLPLSLVLVLAVSLLAYSGEYFVSIPGIVKEKDYLVGYAYNENNYAALKYQELLSRPRPEVLALGSSRVLQFRDSMFPGREFYNAGYTITNAAQYLTFLKRLPAEKLPVIMIISLDQWMFNSNWVGYSASGKWSYQPTTYPKPGILKSLFDDVKKDPGLLKSLVTSAAGDIRYGIMAHARNSGMRKDGSMLYGRQTMKLIKKDTTAADFGFSDTYNRIERGFRRFEYADSITTAPVKALHELLSFCQARGIRVIALLPPFGSAVNEKMRQTGKYKYQQQVYPALARVFKQYRAELWDFSEPKTFGSNDDEMLDGFHGGENSHVKMLLFMAKNGSIIKDYVNPQQLESSLAQATNNYMVFGDRRLAVDRR